MATAPMAILRVEKLKSFGNVAGSLAHTYRTRETPNADQARAGANEHSHAAVDEARMALHARVPEKRRKDAVLALEYFIGASPEWFQLNNAEAQAAYFEGALAWLRERHGADNVVAWSTHYDETSPHLVAYVVPLDGEGKLNAKAHTGGRAKLSAMQTDFATRVGRAHRLERGIEGSRAKHQEVKTWYANAGKKAVQASIKSEHLQPQVLKKGLVRDTCETPDQVAARITRGVRQVYASAMAKAAMADQDRRRADEMATTARDLAYRLETAQEAIAELQRTRDQARADLGAFRAIYELGLTPDQQAELATLANRKRTTNRERAEIQRRAQQAAMPEDRAYLARVDDEFQCSQRAVDEEEPKPESRENHGLEGP
ncbi:MobV family relaxase [Achromobacter kerstersii]|uniref:MobV family relaxase n=1 Tax=Achromobacter kerstersii TaxID=1353890 RepID=UPI0006BF75E4|nr:MobV family relaxase [Achromobacter kerstersii]CUJ74698.1 Plasmid recombination enzyme [Achromobacter kerstersii]